MRSKIRSSGTGGSLLAALLLAGCASAATEPNASTSSPTAPSGVASAEPTRPTERPCTAGPAATSPSEERIVYTRSKEYRDYGIFVARPDLSGSRRIWTAPTPGYTEDIASTQFRPDGKKIVFTVWVDKPGDGHGSITQMYLVDADGGSAARPIGVPNDQYPAFSPDGRCLAFVRSGSIFVTTANGRGRPVRVVAGRGLADPVWSPDGSRIAFTEPRPDDGREDYDTSVISTARADGRSDRRTLTEYHRGVADGGPVYSPDGTTIAFTRYEEAFGDDPQAWTMSSDGGHTRRVSRGDERESALAFSPDGEKLLFAEYILFDPAVDEGDGSYDLVSSNLDGTDRRRLTETYEIDETCRSWIGPSSGGSR